LVGWLVGRKREPKARALAPRAVVVTAA
jgi:hypothetical protein